LKDWFVYIIKSTDERLYTGITTDIVRRWQEHSGTHSKRGAKFFRGRSPECLFFLRKVVNRSQASQLEAEIKKMTRVKKLQLINSDNNQISDFQELDRLQVTND